MGRSLNKVQILGHLGADPETRYLPSGKAVTNIRVATSEQWKDKESGEQKERTEWHAVVFFDKIAEIAGEYTRKGSKVYVAGKLQTRKWKDKEGTDRYTTEIVADEIILLDGKREEQEPEPEQEAAPETKSRGKSNRDKTAAALERVAAEVAGRGRQAAQRTDPPATEDFDDDIPW